MGLRFVSGWRMLPKSSRGCAIGLFEARYGGSPLGAFVGCLRGMLA